MKQYSFLDNQHLNESIWSATKSAAGKWLDNFSANVHTVGKGIRKGADAIKQKAGETFTARNAGYAYSKLSHATGKAAKSTKDALTSDTAKSIYKGAGNIVGKGMDAAGTVVGGTLVGGGLLGAAALAD